MVKITEMEDSFSEDEENQEVDLDSDTDLQEAFSKGILKPGLVAPGENRGPKIFANNVKGLKRKLEELHMKAAWIERLDLTNEPAPLAPELAEKVEEHQQNDKLDSASDDFQRELGFYRQAQAAVLTALPRLHSMGVPTRRPEDYFAQMCKTDQHMHRVREVLAKKQTEMANKEKIRNFRLQKKFSKKVEAESRVNKAAQKKAMLDEVKKFRKGQRKDLDFLEDDAKKPVKKKARLDPSTILQHSKAKGTIKRSQLKRQFKDKKYGQGGRKRGKNANTRESASDVFSSGNKSKAQGGRGTRGGKKQGAKAGKQPRPGKSKRQAKGRR